jgi:N-acetylglucosamine kinase-like BadF-type ATPase
MKYILGVDGGNSKTIAIIASTEGMICGVGRSGCGDIYGAGSPEAALSHIDEAIEQALEKAGIQSEQILAGGFSMAGADWPEDYAWLNEALRGRGYGKNLLLFNDAIGGLRASSPDGTGVAVILGTGVAVGSRRNDGRYWHASFWVRNLCSAYLINEMLTAVFHAELGIAPATGLTAKALAITGTDSPEQLLHRLTRRGADLNLRHGLLISTLLDEATHGDPPAVEIVQKFTDQCAAYATVAAQKAGYVPDSPFCLVLSGGMLRHPSPLLVDLISARVQTSFPKTYPVRSTFEPIIGALFLGFDVAHLPITKSIKQNLIAHMPAPSFFSTS